MATIVPDRNCSQCLPAEVAATVAIANDPSQANGMHRVFVQSTGRVITVNKTKPYYAAITSISPGTWVDWLMAYWYVPAGVLALGVVAKLATRKKRTHG